MVIIPFLGPIYPIENVTYINSTTLFSRSRCDVRIFAAPTNTVMCDTASRIADIVTIRSVRRFEKLDDKICYSNSSHVILHVEKGYYVMTMMNAVRLHSFFQIKNCIMLNSKLKILY